VVSHGLRLFAISVIACAALYGAAAVLGSVLPTNDDWVEHADGTSIYVASNGFHTSLMLPTSAHGTDLSQIFRPTDLPDPDNAGDFLLFGWGDRDFYLSTPTWRHIAPATVVAALTGRGRTLLHVDHIRAPENVPDVRRVRVTSEQYHRLVQSLLANVRLDRDGRPCRDMVGATCFTKRAEHIIYFAPATYGPPKRLLLLA
jgi:uncharacterized protein (TIGR02117 family)